MTDKKQERRGLGRGLSALMADVGAASVMTEGSVSNRRGEELMSVDSIIPNPDQPRRTFSADALEELAASIKARGVIQPLIVRVSPRNPEQFEIVAGERRWRAAQMAQVHSLPVIVRELDDTQVLEIAIIENIQRSDLNPVEEAAGYRQLMDRFGHTQERLAQGLGKSRSHIANLLRLLGLPEQVLALLREGTISSGHARALITADDPTSLANEVVTKGLSVRQTEALVKKPTKMARKGSTREKKEKDADTQALEQDLSAATTMAVSIDHDTTLHSGTVRINYTSLEELDQICALLSRNA